MQNKEMYDKSINVKIKFIQRQFLCCVPVNKIEWLNIFDNFDWEDQKLLINLTCNLDLILKYPIKIDYQKAFLKYILTKVEEQGSEIHDDVYTAFGRVVALGDQNECFKHYVFENNNFLVLKESRSFISEGTTGLCSWQAGIALAEWCLANKSLLQNKIIFEFGSGVGLTGLAVASSCQPQKVILSDCHETVLKVLSENLRINREITERKKSLENVDILNFPWENIEHDIFTNSKADVLLAADVVYDSSLFSSFLSAISRFFTNGTAKELIIACTERNKNTLDEFLTLLATYNLKYQELEVVDQRYFIWSTECPIRIFSVKNEPVI